MGIILDGYYYYNARTANDREMVMPSVLTSLGWNIHRIWTMDWFENSDKIVDAILEEATKLQNQVLPEPEKEDKSELVVMEVQEPMKALHIEPVVTARSNKQKPYLACELAPVQNASGEMIFDFQHRNLIKQQIRQVVEAEAPISKSMLYKKVLQAWNISRAGSRLDKHLEEIISETEVCQIMHHQPFYILANGEGQFDFYRSNETEKRNIDDIAPEEIMVALHEAVAHNLSIEEEELLRFIARTFGFAKVGKQIDSLVRYAIDLTVQDGKVKKEGGRIKAVN